MTLETLKDLVKEYIRNHGEDSLWWEQEKGKEKEFGFPEMLRQEAIKWLKEMGKAEEDSQDAFKKSDGSEPFKANEHAYDDAEGWIKHFFNITDKELE